MHEARFALIVNGNSIMINPILPNPSADSRTIREFMLAHVTQDLKRRAGYVPQKIDESKVIHHEITLGMKKRGIQLAFYVTDVCARCASNHTIWITKYFFLKQSVLLIPYKGKSEIDDKCPYCGNWYIPF